jgi:hypothetical protein
MSDPPDRPLIIDDCLPKRLATELRARGRSAHSVSSLGLKGATDPALVPELMRRFVDPVLITADDHMPADHAEVIAAHGLTIATIEPLAEDRDDDSYEREVVHRWAHRMHEQGSGTIIRYRLGRPLRWRERRR